MVTRRLPAAAGAIVLVAAMSGCASGETAGRSADPSTASTAVARSAHTTDPGQDGDRDQDLPPGDPGLDAPAVPDPGAPPVRSGHGHDRRPGDPAEKALDQVPGQAMLDGRTVGQVLGGTWSRTPTTGDRCLRGRGAAAGRVASFASGERRVVQLVATHAGHAAADRAVRAARARLGTCGWAVTGDPRIGSAALTAARARPSGDMVVVAAEGVTVTLVGTGGSADARARWSALVDLALGNACAAASDGCH